MKFPRDATCEYCSKPPKYRVRVVGIDCTKYACKRHLTWVKQSTALEVSSAGFGHYFKENK